MKMITLLAVAMFAVTACQTVPYQPYAREVKRQPGNGGEIALKAEHRDEDRAKATNLMASNCGTAAVNITEEGEVVVGQTTATSGRESYDQGSSGTKVGSLFGVPVMSGARDSGTNTSTTATTTALKEWNIKYTCAKATAAPATGGKIKKVVTQ